MSPDSPPPFSQDRLPAGVEPPGTNDPKTLGGYRVVGRIGAGGMGAVYAGIDAEGGCAAVKVVHPQFATDPEFRARFAREVDLVSRVRGTCTPAFLGADVQAAMPWLATDYVSGRTLRRHVNAEGPLTGGMLTALAVGLAEALAAIHAKGVTHRDLKPGNVILAPDGPKVLDFGIARATDATGLTRTGGLLGTPGWVAPEQLEGQEASGASDMFAWAGLVAFAATGRDPFGRGAVDVIAYRTRNEDPDLSEVPDSLRPLLERAFAKDPAGRPTAAEALAELTEAWSHTRVGAVEGDDPTEIVPGLLATEWRGISAPEPKKVRRRRGRKWTVALAAALALVLLGGGLFWFDRGAPSSGAASDEPTDGEGSPDEGDAGTVADPDPDALQVDIDPEDGAAVVAEAIALYDEAESFEMYRYESGSMAHGMLELYRYTEDPEPVHYSNTLVGPGGFETLRMGEDLDEVIERTALRGAGFDETPSPYSRTDEDAVQGNPWRFLDDLAELTGPEAEIAYQGVSTVALGDTAWPEEEFDISLEPRTGHHYSGTYTQLRGEGERDAGEEIPLSFDLWVGEDGQLQRFHDFEESDEPDAGGGEGAPEPVNISRETVVLHFGEPVEIEIPDESEIQG